MSRKLSRNFFQREPLICARELIGCTLNWNGCSAVIIETEAYSAVGDEACHTFSRPSAREFVSRHAPGTAYVYFIYGMHWLLNFLVKGGPEDGFVLIRALRPQEGLEQMVARCPGVPKHVLCSGPGRLTKALGIDGKAHGFDIFSKNSSVSIYKPKAHVPVLATPRIGIRKATDLPWRFVPALDDAE